MQSCSAAVGVQVKRDVWKYKDGLQTETVLISLSPAKCLLSLLPLPQHFTQKRTCADVNTARAMLSLPAQNTQVKGQTVFKKNTFCSSWKQPAAPNPSAGIILTKGKQTVL